MSFASTDDFEMQFSNPNDADLTRSEPDEEHPWPDPDWRDPEFNEAQPEPEPEEEEAAFPWSQVTLNEPCSDRRSHPATCDAKRVSAEARALL